MDTALLFEFVDGKPAICVQQMLATVALLVVHVIL